MCCRSEKCLAVSAALALVSALLVGGVQLWLKEKSYVFSAEELETITKQALRTNSSVPSSLRFQPVTPLLPALCLYSAAKGHEATFDAVEAVLRERYPGHILPPSQTEWMFVNAGGWMGAMYLLHASLTEYVLFFGAAVDTSGHSGRYWANISDTVISGEYRQWREGTTEFVVYKTGDTILHGVGEATAIHWQAGTWMVEYGRGFIPSTLGFALSDTIFGTQDFYILYRTLRIYIVALVQEILIGNV